MSLKVFVGKYWSVFMRCIPAVEEAPKTVEEASVVAVAGSRWSKADECLNAKLRHVGSLCGSGGCEPSRASYGPELAEYTSATLRAGFVACANTC